MIRILGTVFAGLLGLAFGSFLNVFVTRWPEGESIVTPRSHCRRCEHALAWWENIPLLSWFLLRGRCRSCRGWIGWRYPAVELAVGALWAYAAWNASAGMFEAGVNSSNLALIIVSAAGQMIFYWLILALATLDAEYLWLPDVLTFPGIALGFAVSMLIAAVAGQPYIVSPAPLQVAEERGLGILIAGGLILLIRWIYWVFRRREGMGLGDAKLMAVLAAWLGLPLTLLAFAIGAFAGAIAGVVVIAVPAARTDRENWATSKLPFGTFLCIGGIISSMWGPAILSAYLHMAGW